MKFTNTMLTTVEEYDMVIKKLKNAINIIVNESEMGF